LALAVPGLIGSALDPVIGVLGDTGRRRAVMALGGLAFAVSVALTSAAVGFWTLLAALVIGNPASGALVSLAQATLMDLAPAERERNMARWTLAGSFGYVGGPLLLAAALWIGAGWRLPLAALAAAAVPLAFAVRRLPRAPAAADMSGAWHHTWAALRRLEVLRRLAVLEAADLLVDIFHGYLALYFVDVAHVDAGAAALGVAVWTAAGLVGDWSLLWVLRRIRGRRYLRCSALAALAAYPAFLLVPGYPAKLVLVAVLGLLNSGWYAIPQAGLYESLPSRSAASAGWSAPACRSRSASSPARSGSGRRCGSCCSRRSRSWRSPRSASRLRGDVPYSGCS
jgi:MFS transporter, FSR family, fosmidomycin resistance protein